MNLLAKVLLTLVLAVTVALAAAGVLAARGARTATQAYVSASLNEQGEAVAAEAALAYAQTGSWEHTQALVDASSMADAMDDGGMMGGMMGGMGGGPMMGGGMMRRMGRMHSWTLLSPTENLPLASTGVSVNDAALAMAVPLLAGGQPIARLAPNLLPSGLTQAEEIFLQQLQRALWISALVAGLVALAAGSVLAASILRPLRRVETAVETIARGDLAARVDPVGHDEIGRLAAGVNTLASNLQRQEQLRQRMVSDIAHELRTPLSVIQGNLQAILDGVYPLDAAEIRILSDETRILARLVEDLHELALAEAQRLPLDLDDVPAALALNQAAASFHALAGGRGVSLLAGAPPALAVRADPGRLQQILHNLVANALRHTAPGGSVRLDAAEAGAQICFTVADSGAGIAAADLPHVFDRFYRADKERTRTAPEGETPSGAGLGLAIVKALVEAHGGIVGARSEPGTGATLWFTLPRATGAAPDA